MGYNARNDKIRAHAPPTGGGARVVTNASHWCAVTISRRCSQPSKSPLQNAVGSRPSVRCCNRLCLACERMTRPPASLGSNCPRPRGITLDRRRDRTVPLLLAARHATAARRRIALETASRRGEVVQLGPQHVRNGRIKIERTHGSADVDIPMTLELEAACDAMPKAHLTYIRNRLRQAALKIRAWQRFCKMGDGGRVTGTLPFARTQKRAAYAAAQTRA